MRGLFSQEGTYKSNPVIATNDRVKIVFVFRKILLWLLQATTHAREKDTKKSTLSALRCQR